MNNKNHQSEENINQDIANSHQQYLKKYFNECIYVRYIKNNEFCYNSGIKDIINTIKECLDPEDTFTYVRSNIFGYALLFRSKDYIPKIEDYANIINIFDKNFRERLNRYKKYYRKDFSHISLDKLYDNNSDNNYDFNEYLNVKNQYDSIIYSKS